MNRIFYFNIIYRCNENCVFCFSNSTSNYGKIMQSDIVIKNLISLNPDNGDLIVLNGGEPTIHPDFYDLLSKLKNKFTSEISVYTNGSVLRTSKLKDPKGISFIIPIHGTESQHDAITQINGSYKKTIRNLCLLDSMGYRYRIKFIVNDNMVSNKFSFTDFLIKYRLKPEEIIIARLNRTTKSEKNQVPLPPDNKTIPYLYDQVHDLHNNYKIKFLDYPLCWIGCSIFSTEYDIPAFYFNDFDNNMKVRTYYKDVMISADCIKCKYYDVCNIMHRSYLTLSLEHNNYQLERE